MLCFSSFLPAIWLGKSIKSIADYKNWSKLIISRERAIEFLSISDIDWLLAAAVREPEASEWGSSLIGKKLHYRGIQSLFLTRSKELSKGLIRKQTTLHVLHTFTYIHTYMHTYVYSKQLKTKINIYKESFKKGF